MSATETIRRRRKAVIYATNGRRLLVFKEVAHPEIDWQPPGGTIGDGETTLAGAMREFTEETGLPSDGSWTTLGSCTYRYPANGADHIHERHFFHLVLKGPQPERFQWWETNRDDGGPPILFAFAWHHVDDPNLTFFGHLDALLPELRRRIALENAR